MCALASRISTRFTTLLGGNGPRNARDDRGDVLALRPPDAGRHNQTGLILDAYMADATATERGPRLRPERR
jgi:hypothetical protein